MVNIRNSCNILAGKKLVDKSARHKLISLQKMILYILTQRPDEFGLYLEEDRSVSLKELLQALHEEEDWRYVRRSHLQDIYLVDNNPGFTLTDGRVRLSDPAPSPLVYTPSPPPKILYFAGRRKAHAHILERGLSPMGRTFLPLALSKEMALRIGKRRDPHPTLFEVHAEKAWKQGVAFRLAHELIYLVESLGPEFITGPPVPKQPEKVEKKKPVEAMPAQTPGSFFLDPDRMAADREGVKIDKRTRRKMDKKTSSDRKAARREKRRR